MPSVLAIGLDPAIVDLKAANLTPEMVRAFIYTQLDRLSNLGYEVESCFVHDDENAKSIVAAHLAQRDFDCIMIGAGLRAEPMLLLFENLLNLIHTKAPRSKICFNTTPADTAEAVKRWV